MFYMPIYGLSIEIMEVSYKESSKSKILFLWEAFFCFLAKICHHYLWNQDFGCFCHKNCARLGFMPFLLIKRN